LASTWKNFPYCVLYDVHSAASRDICIWRTQSECGTNNPNSSRQHRLTSQRHWPSTT